ncbi:MAG: hypothetical protein M3Q36_03420 [bacterium]|nr:hypothetical protein [bacterium]
MSFYHWEDEIEFFDLVGDQLLPRDSDPLAQTINLHNDIPQGSRIEYDATHNRHVIIKVMGFTASQPNVIVSKIHAGGRERLHRGLLLGSLHPDLEELFPGIIRTSYYPILAEVGMSGGKLRLPKPLKELRALDSPAQLKFR